VGNGEKKTVRDEGGRGEGGGEGNKYIGKHKKEGGRARKKRRKRSKPTGRRPRVMGEGKVWRSRM